MVTWLSAKYKRDQSPTGATRLGENPTRGMEAWQQRNDDSRTRDVIGAVEGIAADHGVSASRVALSWLAGRPAVTSVILGARTTEQLDGNLAAADATLSAEETQRLTDISKPRVGGYPYGPMAQEQRSRKAQGGR